MKNLIKKSLILVGAAASVTAVASDVDLTYKQAENGKYGYVDKSGNWVVEPTFDDCSYFGDNGLANVRKDGKYNLIDRDGNLLSTNWSKRDFYGSFGERPLKLYVISDDSAALIDVNGKVVLKASKIDTYNADDFIFYTIGRNTYVADPSMVNVVPHSAINGYVSVGGGLLFFFSRANAADHLVVYDVNDNKVFELKKKDIHFERIDNSTYKSTSDKDDQKIRNLYGGCVPYVISYKDVDGYHVTTVDGEEVAFKKTNDYQIGGKIIAKNRGKIFKLMLTPEYAAEYDKRYIDSYKSRAEKNKQLMAQYPTVNMGAKTSAERRPDGRYALKKGDGGNAKILAVYDSIVPHDNYFMAFNEGKIGMLTRQGNVVIPIVHDYMEVTGIKNSFNEFFIVPDGDKYKFISLMGGSSNSFDEIIPAHLPDGSLGYYVTNGDKWGFTVPSPAVGHPYFEMAYDYIGDFDSSMTAPVSYKGFSGKINKEGKLAEDILAPLFRKAKNEDGLNDQQCIALYNKIIEYDKTLKEGYTAISYNNIGYHYEELGDIDNAYSYYERAKNMGNETGKSNYNRIKMDRIANALNSFAQNLSNTAAAMSGYQLSSSDMASIQSSTGFTAPDAGFSTAGGNYESQYRNWERRAQANYESLTNTGYKTKQGGNYKGGSNGRSLNGGNYVRQKQALREAQRQMASIRSKARSAGVNIPQSQYETVTVNY